MIGKGKIDIAIPKTNFNPGEVISGIATLTMKKTAKARKFTVSLIGEQKITQAMGTSRSRTPRTVRIYDFEQQLDGEKEYKEGGVYPFEVKIPEDILEQQKTPQMPQMEGKLGTALGIAQSLAGMGITKRTSWYLIARLDIPLGTDVKEKVQITIG
jgi:hypothetical protein